MNIDHIVLLVDNQQRSLAFFVDLLGMGWPRSIHACSMGAPAPWREGAANFPITSRPRQHQMRGAIRPGSFQREGQGVGTDR